MTINTLFKEDEKARKALANFFRDEAFKDIRIAFVSNMPKLPEEETPVAVELGTIRGVAYVFNTIERLLTQKPEQPIPPSGPDPDLSGD